MANPSAEWTRVVFHPLGLVGYVLFLVFGLVARAKRRDERRWLLPVVVAAGFIALFAGLGLAYRDVTFQNQAAIRGATRPMSPTPKKQEIRSVNQKSSAPCSPNIVTAGTVTVNCGEESTHPETQKTSSKSLTKKPQ